MNRPPLPSTLFPYTTLFRSLKPLEDYRADLTVISGLCHPKSRGGHSGADTWLTAADLEGTPGKDYQNAMSVDRSEEHTSELQSQSNLVCRLLLEKKKQTNAP